MADKSTSGEEYGEDVNYSTGTRRKTLKGDPTKKGFVNPAEGNSSGLGALAKALAEKRKKKEMESLGQKVKP